MCFTLLDVARYFKSHDYTLDTITIPIQLVTLYQNEWHAR